MIDSKSILNLVTAGYTKSEIIQMFGEPEQQPQPQPQPEPQPEPQPKQATTNDLMLAIKALTEAVQLSNRNKAEQPENNKLTGDSVMSTFIN